MLVQLGQRPPEGDVVDLLGACHARIRKFIVLARRLASDATPPPDAQEVAGQIRRYFCVAFPLHLADEDELVVPRLRGRNAAVDRALAQMSDDHENHEPYVAHLVELCTVIERDPAHLARCRDELAAATNVLAMALEPHLQLEEREIFPALRQLPKTLRDEIRAEMRARRTVS